MKIVFVNVNVTSIRFSGNLNSDITTLSKDSVNKGKWRFHLEHGAGKLKEQDEVLFQLHSGKLDMI